MAGQSFPEQWACQRDKEAAKPKTCWNDGKNDDWQDSPVQGRGGFLSVCFTVCKGEGGDYVLMKNQRRWWGTDYGMLPKKATADEPAKWVMHALPKRCFLSLGLSLPDLERLP